MATHLILIVVTVAFATGLMLYYVLIFRKISTYASKSYATKEPVSVIIASRNEFHNLNRFLDSILTQEYPQYEVIVVNDGSFDDTKDFLKDKAENFPHLHMVDLNIDEQYQKGKKFALTMGIKAARYERLLFTDADCEAPGKHWISTMVRDSDGKDIVLGYGPLRTNHTPLGAIIFYETFHTALQYFSYAMSGMTYMGVGRNLSYKKENFFKNKGFASHQHLISGDDDLFIQEVATRENVAVCLDPQSFMSSEGPAGFGAWIRQKQRHVSTADHYKGKYRFLLGMYSFFHIMFYLALLLNVFFKENWILAGGVLALKWLVQWLIFYKPAQMLNARTISYFLPLYDFYYTLYLLLLGVVKPFYRGKRWK